MTEELWKEPDELQAFNDGAAWMLSQLRDLIQVELNAPQYPYGANIYPGLRKALALIETLDRVGS